MTRNFADISQKIGFVGAGNMAAALIRGLIQAGFPPTQLIAADLDKEKTAELQKQLKIQVAAHAPDLIAQSDVVVLATKPSSVLSLCQAQRDLAHGRLWLSVAAGVPTSDIEQALGGSAKVVRAMPNTPALVGEGATGLCKGAHATDDDIALAEHLMNAVGTTVQVPENLMDAVTGLSGSGPAYIMLVIEALADGGVRAGLPRSIALQLATQTVRGSATLAQKTGQHPGVLKDMVTSPGGTTICGVQKLEENGLRNALISAVVAATEQSLRLREK